MTTKYVAFTFTILICFENLLGQDTLKHQSKYPSGLSFEYGIGDYSVKDEYISKEKYSGTLPLYSLVWAREHENYVYKLKMAYRYSNNIKNYNVSTNIHQLILNQGFVYTLDEITIFNRDLYIWLGPSTEFFIYFNKPNIAFSGFDYAQSYAALASVGINCDAIYPVKNNFKIESSVSMTVLSMGFHLVDTEEDNESSEKLLTLFSGLNSSLDIGVRYYILNRLSLKLVYKFELTRISAWDSLLSISDNVVIAVTFKL